MTAAEGVEAGWRPGDVLVERYELEELVGLGGMASVFAAMDRVLERRVAVKLLHRRLASDPVHVDRFRREASMVAGLAHENIVTVIDRGEDQGVPFIVFEYVPGENLKELLLRVGPLPLLRTLDIAISIARALAFAHSRSCVHRDVKPQNVLISSSGAIKVADFGIARSLSPGGGVTETGTVLGSADYLSPEQAQGLQVGEAADIYSLGVILYELLTGEVPFAGESFFAVAVKHVNEPPPRASARRGEVPPSLDRAIAIALAKSPAARFATMDAFREALEACRREIVTGVPASQSTLVLAGGAVARPQRSRRTFRRLALLALAVVLAAVAALVVLGVVPRLDRGDHAQGAPPKRAAASAPAAAAQPVVLKAVAAYDPPPGDGVEDNSRLALATDRNPSTAWVTEHYATASFGNLKDGVGIVVDAGKAERLTAITVETDTPGFTAVIKSGDSVGGPFAPASASRTVGRATTFALTVPQPRRYYLLWITSLSPSGSDFAADVDEVTARTAG
ncbi:MAG TPA: protein kinase [Gaiellaceae bacterium]|nr:protein kinase [Gaiellaceae bacterium]